MQFDHYVVAAVLGTLVIGGAAFPLLVAATVAWWPGRQPSYKLAFVITATVIVLGTAGLVSLLSLPFELFGTYISPQLEYDGHKIIPMVMGWIFTATRWLPYVVIAVGSVAVPIALRRRLWGLLCSSLSSLRIEPARPQAGRASSDQEPTATSTPAASPPS